MFDAGAIVGKIKLDMSEFNDAVSKALGKVDDLGRGMRSLGADIASVSKQVGQVGTSLTYLGAGVLTPLIATFKSSEKYSNAVRYEMERLTNAGIQLRVSVSESLVPVMHRLSNIVADLSNRWMALPSQVRQNITQFAFMSGVVLTLGGAVIYLIGKIGLLAGTLLKLSGAFLSLIAVNPYLAITYALVGAIVFAMFRWKSVADIVLNSMQILGEIVSTSLKSVVAAFNTLMTGLNRIMAFLIGLAEKLPGPFKDSLKELRAFYDASADAMSATTKNLQTDINGTAERITGILQGKGQTWAESFDDFKTSLTDIKGLFSGLGNTEISLPDKIFEATKSFSEGWTDALRETLNQLTDWGSMAGSIVQQTASFMQSTISSFVQGFFKGEITSLKELVLEFGNFAIKIISDVIAQIITARIVAGAMNLAIGVATGGVGTVVSTGVQSIAGNTFTTAFSGGYAEGIERVPYTGMYKLHADETVVPKYDSQRQREVQITVVNQITPSFVNAAIASEPDTVINVINSDTLRNGMTRRTQKVTS